MLLNDSYSIFSYVVYPNQNQKTVYPNNNNKQTNKHLYLYIYRKNDIQKKTIEFSYYSSSFYPYYPLVVYCNVNVIEKNMQLHKKYAGAMATASMLL